MREGHGRANVHLHHDGCFRPRGYLLALSLILLEPRAPYTVSTLWSALVFSDTNRGLNQAQ